MLVTEDLSWREALTDTWDSAETLELRANVKKARDSGVTIFPPEKDVFTAFRLTPLNKIKVVILGQDPYHQPNQAHGLSFSVLPNIKIPASLRNIYKELQDDLGIEPAKHGCLEAWARQGVMLLNTVLTVEYNKPGSHQNIGWQKFTNRVLEIINAKSNKVVFMLWGAYAAQYKDIIDGRKHLILMSSHPSPLSAYRGFLGCKHFSKANEFLKKNKKKVINWKLPRTPG